MRFGSAAALALTALAIGVLGSSPAPAQFFDSPFFRPQQAPPRQAPQVVPAPGGGYTYLPPQPIPGNAPPPRRRAEPRNAQPRATVQPAPEPAPGLTFRRLFGFEEAPRRQPAPEQAAPRPRPRPTVAKAAKPKSETSVTVAVFGDTLAEGAGQGLVDAYDDNPDIDVVRRTRGDGGLVRIDVSDWPKIVQEALDQNPKVAVGVMMAGANDRQPIREGDKVLDPLSERWREIYRDRVDAVVKVFQDRNIPLIWIGVPPMRNEKASADVIALNDIYRDRVQRAGGTYVDIWPGFVNDENRYSVSGPDIAGQNARLRGNDGVNFTRAGGRKVAFFADSEIKRLVEAKRGAAALAGLPGPAPTGPAAPSPGAPAPAPPAAVGAAGPPSPAPDQVANALPPPPEPAAAPVLPAKPVAGPVLPLNRPEVAPGGTLISTRPKLDGEAAQKALREGVAPAPKPGRADDFRWPRT